MIKRYKEIFFGLLLGLAMWVADAQMHTMMPADSPEQQPALAEELFSPDGLPLAIRLLYFSFALFAGWLLWRSNQSERSVDDLENTAATISINWRARMINPTSNILDECNALLVSSTLTGEAVTIVKSIRRHAQQIEDFTNVSQPLPLIPGRSSNTYIGSWRQLLCTTTRHQSFRPFAPLFQQFERSFPMRAIRRVIPFLMIRHDFKC
ncbi:MAG: hypothetical protein AB7U82_14020, partial [Blastocatellales bacterium]